MDQPEVLIRSLAIAAIIVAPYAIHKVRGVIRLRRAHDSLEARETEAQRRATTTHGDLPALEDVIGDIGFVEREARLNGGALLVVPHAVTVSDRPAAPEIVDALIRDALRRSNLVVTAEVDSPEGRLLECALTGTSVDVQHSADK